MWIIAHIYIKVGLQYKKKQEKRETTLSPLSILHFLCFVTPLGRGGKYTPTPISQQKRITNVGSKLKLEGGSNAYIMCIFAKRKDHKS